MSDNRVQDGGVSSSGIEPGETARHPVPSRRTFIAGAGAAALAGLAAGCSDGEAAQGGQESTGKHTVAPFRSSRQLGVLQSPTPAGLVAAFDSDVADADALAATCKDLSAEIERIMAGRPLDAAEDFLPPEDSGAIDASSSLTGTAITVAVGASLFDDRYGLGDRRPRELIPMPTFFNDRLVRDELSHGDIALTIVGQSPQAIAYALHQVVRVTDRRLRLRWVQEGHNQLLPESPDRVAETRNLMGFRDGTSNLDANDDDIMNEQVWVGDEGPDWAVGGTYQAVRIIRMLIEFWARAALVRQEQIFGRHRDSGAPVGQANEADEPAFALDPADLNVAPRSHIRLANPRQPGTGRILRRGFSYLNGADTGTATLDQGLLFLAYQRSLERGFLEVQSRLNGEPLEDYVKPVGGGLFFVLPGPGADGWLGESLFA